MEFLAGKPKLGHYIEPVLLPCKIVLIKVIFKFLNSFPLDHGPLVVFFWNCKYEFIQVSHTFQNLGFLTSLPLNHINVHLQLIFQRSNQRVKLFQQ